MVKRSIILVLLVGVVVLFTGCDTATKIIGTLILQTGQSGDVQNSRVELYEKADLTGTPVKEVGSEQSGNTTRSPFEFSDVIEGYYYLLAWKDLDGDGEVSDKDIVGVYGGEYRPGYGGAQLTVTNGKTTDVGEIVMLIYKELKITASGVRVNNNTETNFNYSFNYDVTVTSLTITFPGYAPMADPDAPGPKTAGTTYNSDGWNVGGGVMPTGAHNLNFAGSWDGTTFDIDVTVQIN